MSSGQGPRCGCRPVPRPSACRSSRPPSRSARVRDYLIEACTRFICVGGKEAFQDSLSLRERVLDPGHGLVTGAVDGLLNRAGTVGASGQDGVADGTSAASGTAPVGDRAEGIGLAVVAAGRVVSPVPKIQCAGLQQADSSHVWRMTGSRPSVIGRSPPRESCQPSTGAAIVRDPIAWDTRSLACPSWEIGSSQYQQSAGPRRQTLRWYRATVSRSARREPQAPGGSLTARSRPASPWPVREPRPPCR
jgi:hypothetical protein